MFLSKLLALILFLISFGILICIHEAGHLSMAKLFGVYCKEYSIGFGPAILSKKKEGHETKFSIRAVPLGGYVSMYGEEGQEEVDEELKDIPLSRSLEGIKKWKKAIVVSAGVILNAILAFFLIATSYLAFTPMVPTRRAVVEENSAIALAGVKNNDSIQFILPDSLKDDKAIYAFQTETDAFYIVDPDVKLENGITYSLTFFFTGDKGNLSFVDGLSLYPAISKSELANSDISNQLFGTWAAQDNSPEYYPNLSKPAYALDEKTTFFADILFENGETGETYSTSIEFKTSLSGRKYKFNDIGLKFLTVVDEEENSFSKKMQNTWSYYGQCASAVFRGLGKLFTGQFNQLSGVVGIFDMSSQILNNYRFATYLRFWGLISVNLAIFNLLPFPGLDGWQLLVTAVEGISHKKLPSKFKTIMSLIGLAILFLLMIAIVILDILGLLGLRV